MLAITDTGIGMEEKVKTRLFEPLFTTKPVGQGTGLRLSTCYGIIKQSGGHISVYSEEGRGTSFKIYLPNVESHARVAVERKPSPGLPRGTESILLVEDDPVLREMSTTLLKRFGYTVWAAANGIDALNLKQQRQVGHIDLLLTHVVMPHMSGKELADGLSFFVGSDSLRGSMWALFKEFLKFCKQEKKWWLIPLVVLLLVLGAILLFAGSSGIAWALYPFM